jgi:hypothetical protein
VSALCALETIASQAKVLHHDVCTTQSKILATLEDIVVRPPPVNRRAICRLLERPHYCDDTGLLELNALLLIDRPSMPLGGKVRKTQTWVGVRGSPIEDATYIPPEPSRVPVLFAEFIRRWSNERSQFDSRDSHEVCMAMAQFHHGLVWLHPFEDGNGSVARVLTDYQARHLLYFDVGLKLKSDSDYPAALKAADCGDFVPFASLIHRLIMAE